MGLMSGALTVRRFKVVGSTPPDWRDAYRDRLNAMAFREPGPQMGKEELEGWVQVHNLLDTEFDDLNRWLYGNYAVFSLRVDKKTLPANLFRATVEKQAQAWAQEHGVERCPAAKKKELKEELEEAWLKRTLPRVATTEICWHVTEGWLLVGGLSERTVERVRKRFHRTFGLELHAWSPLDYVAAGGVADQLLGTSPTIVGGVA
ncbi:MAG: recombination-associated protein RdgC [Alphaproteobacteria bacterium]|nr:recombination-associated protein RdgC [Alphaproteobacteria bacterium]